MIFKSLRSHSKSSSKSTKPSTLTRILSSESTHRKIPEVVVSPPLSAGAAAPGQGRMLTEEEDRHSEEDVSTDYNEFLEKAKKEAEKEKKEQEKKAKKAREVNMSPWASRMNC